MISSLPLFHRIRGQKVLVLGNGEAAEPKKRLVERASGIVEPEMQRAIDEGVRLAFIALDDSQACEAAAIKLRRAGMLVNVVDMPELCDFTTPSILDRDPVLVAIGTGGASAGLAKHVRLRLEAILPQSLGMLAGALNSARARLRELFPDASQRRRALDEALREGGALDVLRAESAAKVDGWIAAAQEPHGERREMVKLSSLDPEDLTLRQARLLGEADTLLIDGDVPEQILARARADAARLGLTEAPAADLPGLTVVIVAPGQTTSGPASAK